MQKFKKTICFMLALSLCLILCSCGTMEKNQERLSIRLKGSDTRKIRLSVFTELPEGYGPSVVVSNNEAGDPALVIEQMESKQAGTIKYTITAPESPQAGVFTASISFKDDKNNVYGSVLLMIGVSEKGKLTCHNADLSGRDEYVPIEEEESVLPENAEVSNYTGNSKEIKVSNSEGRWYIEEKSYNDTVIDPQILDQEDEEFTIFRVFGISKGVSDLTVYNEEAELKIKMSFAVTEDEEAEDNGAVQYIIELTDSKSSEYDKTQTEEYKAEQTSAENMIRHVLPDAFIPSGVAFDNCYVYKYSKVDNHVDFEKYKVAVGTLYLAANDKDKAAAQKALDALFKDKDSGDVIFEKDGIMYSYTVTKAVKTDKLMAALTKEVSHSEPKEITAGDKTVSYIIADDGFGAAVFSDGKYSYAILGLDEFTDEQFAGLITAIVSSNN